MKDPLKSRRKVVIRHLPPSLSQSDLLSRIDDRFSDRYHWFSFFRGTCSNKHQMHSRAYIDFKTSEDVFEFAEFFDRHVFVNEKGTQFKTKVEFAPSQRVPKQCKKDGREGTIYKDPDYLEFLKLIAKPVESRPSAEIQLERKEAEQSGLPKESPVITPLMEFIRQKRAAENEAQGFRSVGKVSKRTGLTSKGKLDSQSCKRSSEKKYRLKDGTKNNSRKNKPTYVTTPRRDHQPAACTVVTDSSLPGVTFSTEFGKKKLLLKTKQREISLTLPVISQLQGTSSSVGSPAISTANELNQRCVDSDRLIETIPRRQSHSSARVQPAKRPPILNTQSGLEYPSEVDTKKAQDDKFVKDLHGFGATGEKRKKHTRNKNRSGCRYSEVIHTSEESMSSSASHPTHSLRGFVTGEMKDGIPSSKAVDQPGASTRSHSYSREKGSNRHNHRSTNSNANEKHKWVQKSFEES